ncbi:hypothetical protein, partial [Paenibacillus forsythiae]
EDGGLLPQLKELLQRHPGAVPTLLFYERAQRLIALSDSFRIKPSPELFGLVESLLGQGTIRIK